jgi:hypothetical protein
VRGGLGEFRQRLLGYQVGILPNPCSRVLHGLPTEGLTPRSEAGRKPVIKSNHCFRPLRLDVRHCHDEKRLSGKPLSASSP